MSYMNFADGEIHVIKSLHEDWPGFHVHYKAAKPPVPCPIGAACNDPHTCMRAYLGPRKEQP